MKDRILRVRKEAKLNQEDFARKINLTKNYISLLETGNRVPSDRTISDICREFNINENWLRTGQGEMQLPIEDETAAIVSDLLDKNNPMYDIIKGIIKTYQKLDTKSQQIIDDFAKKLLDGLNGGD